MDFLVLILLIVFSSAFSGSKKAKQQREKRLQDSDMGEVLFPNLSQEEPVPQRPVKKPMPAEKQVLTEQSPLPKGKSVPQGKKPPQADKLPQKKPIAPQPMQKEPQKRRILPQEPVPQRQAVVIEKPKERPVHEKVHPTQHSMHKPLAPHIKTELQPIHSALHSETKTEPLAVHSEQEQFALGLGKKDLVNGLILAEVLGKPRALQPHKNGRR